MLARTPEPELMNAADQAQAYAEADFSATDATWIARWVHAWGPPTGRIVDLGCGPGNMAFGLLDAGPCTVVGVDGAPAMLAYAESAAAVSSTRRARVRFVCARLPTSPEDLPGAPFDGVISNSLLHHLHDPDALWRTVRALARPGAHVLVADLRRPASADDADALTRRYAADAPDVLRRDFHASLHAAFTPDEVSEQLARNGLHTLQVEAVGDRHLVVFGTLPSSTEASTSG